MRFIKKIFSFIFLIIFIAVMVVAALGYGKYKQAIGLLPIQTAAKNIKSDDSFTPFDEISKTFTDAMVAVEDRRFYKHKGVDIIGIGRAIKTNIEKRSLSEGGSCITQQLAKNIYFMHDSSISRKVAEVMIALNLEKEFSKEEILELYFNVIYYGSDYYNIADACRGYFGKTPLEITDYEATLLAGIPNAPSVYSLNSNPDLAKKRQKTVIKAMVDMKYMTKEWAQVLLEMN